MGNWKNVYKEEKFSIRTALPSQIVSKGIELLNLPFNFRALDLGCGNGRNTIYLAKLGGSIDAIDLANLSFKKTLPLDIQSKIRFHQMSCVDFNIESNTYTAIVATV